MQIIISCGGGGTRLWPVSTDKHPKQLIPLLDDQSLMLKTYNRVRQTFSPQQIWVTVNYNHLDLVKSILPAEFNQDQIIVEPVKKDTFAAITLASAIIASKTSQDEPLVFIPSDDWIEDENDIKVLNQALHSIGQSLEEKQFDFITVGIKPHAPSTQFGYLEIDSMEGEKIENGIITAVKSFKEKPDEDIAIQYLQAGNYFWHKHNPSLTYSSLLKNMQKHWPQLVPVLQDVYNKQGFDLSHFDLFPKLSLDYAILDKADKIGMVPLDIKWSDVGTWDTVYGYLNNLDNENQIEIDGENNKVKLENSNLKVAFVGVSNLLVVQTESGLLILDPSKSAEVKNVSAHFKGK